MSGGYRLYSMSQSLVQIVLSAWVQAQKRTEGHSSVVQVAGASQLTIISL